jgi:hypothetical protein
VVVEVQRKPIAEVTSFSTQELRNGAPRGTSLAEKKVKSVDPCEKRPAETGPHFPRRGPAARLS